MLCYDIIITRPRYWHVLQFIPGKTLGLNPNPSKRPPPDAWFWLSGTSSQCSSKPGSCRSSKARKPTEPPVSNKYQVKYPKDKWLETHCTLSWCYMFQKSWYYNGIFIHLFLDLLSYCPIPIMYLDTTFPALPHLAFSVRLVNTTKWVIIFLKRMASVLAHSLEYSWPKGKKCKLTVHLQTLFFTHIYIYIYVYIYIYIYKDINI